MAHWAQIDENSIVINVTVGNNEDPDEGYQWLIDNLGGTWIKTSYNTKEGVHLLGGEPLRKNFASVGFLYDPIRDAFIPPKIEEYQSWILDEERCIWVAPQPKPTNPSDGMHYIWDEETTSWIETDIVEI
jgi:hypothetical protein